MQKDIFSEIQALASRNGGGCGRVGWGSGAIFE